MRFQILIVEAKTNAYTDDEGVVEGGKDASHAENMFTVSNGWTKSDIFLLWLPNLSPRLHNK